MSLKSRVVFDALRSLAFGSISASYANVGTATDHPIVAFRITNNTQGDMIFSVNGGIEDHMFIAANSFVLYDLRANINSNSQVDFVLPTHTQFAVKQVTAPVSGSVYIDVIHDA